MQRIYIFVYLFFLLSFIYIQDTKGFMIQSKLSINNSKKFQQSHILAETLLFSKKNTNTKSDNQVNTKSDNQVSSDNKGTEPKYIVALVVFLLACLYDKIIYHGGF